MNNPAKLALDAIDRAILLALQEDARIANLALADRVGLSPSPCSRRVRLLEAAGAIRGYRAVLDRPTLGFGLTVFANVRVERHSREHADAFVAAVLGIPNVVACHLVSGDADFLLEVVVPDMETYESVVLRQLLDMKAIRDIRSNFAMRTFKTEGPLPLGSTGA